MVFKMAVKTAVKTEYCIHEVLLLSVLFTACGISRVGLDNLFLIFYFLTDCFGKCYLLWLMSEPLILFVILTTL